MKGDPSGRPYSLQMPDWLRDLGRGLRNVVMSGLFCVACDTIIPQEPPLPYPDDVEVPVPDAKPHPAPDAMELSEIFISPDAGSLPEPSAEVIGAGATSPDITILDTTAVYLDGSPQNDPMEPDVDLAIGGSDTGTPVPPAKDAGPDLTSPPPIPCDGFVDTDIFAASSQVYCLSLQPVTGIPQGPASLKSIEAIDTDQDSLDDLMLLSEAGTLQVWRNNFPNGFQDVTAQSALPTTGVGFLAWGNGNDDDWPDLLLGMDQGVRPFWNQGGTFNPFGPIYLDSPARCAAWLGTKLLIGTDQGPRLLILQNDGAALDQSALLDPAIVGVEPVDGIAVTDFDLDGLPDAYLWRSVGDNLLLRQLPDGTFQSLAPVLGVLAVGNTTQALWVDGWPDTLFPYLVAINYNGNNYFFQNNQGSSFQEIGQGLAFNDPGSTLQAATTLFPGLANPIFQLSRFQQPDLLLVPQYDANGLLTHYQNRAYEAGLNTPAGSWSIGARFFHFDNDNTLDLVRGRYDGTIHVWRNLSHTIVKETP